MYNKGDKVLIKSRDWYDLNKQVHNIFGEFVDCGSIYFIMDMIPFLGEILTIDEICSNYYICLETGYEYSWTDEMIECLIESKELTKEEKLIQLIQDNSNLPQEEFNILIESYLDSLIPYNHGNFEISESCNIDTISVTNRIKELRDEYKGSDFSIIVENIIKNLSKRELAFLLLANYITAK